MSITVTEKVESRRLVASRDGKASTFDLVLNVRGTANELKAKNAASAFAPEVWGSGFPQLWKQTVTVEPVVIDGEDSLWLATVHYDTSGPEPLSANDSFEFSTHGGTQNVTQALASVAKYPSDAPNYQGAIGVTDSGVEGVDIVVPQLTFRETHYFAELSGSYKLLLAALSGKVNSTPFRGFAAGEVLFIGVDAYRADSKHETPWVVTYEFAVQANRSNFVVGGIPVAFKYGWDYMWVRYGPSISEDTLVRVPRSVHIERVYDFTSFAALGIGT